MLLRKERSAAYAGVSWGMLTLIVLGESAEQNKNKTKNAKFGCARGRGRPAGRVGGAWGRPRPRAHPNLAFFLFFFLRRGFSKHSKNKVDF